MKKLILFILSLILLVLLYLNFKQYLPASITGLLGQNNEITTTTEMVTTTEETTIEATTTLSVEEVANLSLFNEEVPADSKYGHSNVPEQLVGKDLYSAIDAYYTESYSNDEKQANQTAVSEEDLQSLENILKSIEGLESVDFTVDQVTMTLDNQTVYVPRIIFPMSYENADRILKENDLKVLTEAMTQLGNRLVMVAYYQPETKTLTVYHLTNWTNPLFTYSVE